MSSNHSVLLSIIPMIIQDLYGQYTRPGVDQVHLAMVGDKYLGINDPRNMNDAVVQR